jgi:hypothetical protein
MKQVSGKGFLPHGRTSWLVVTKDTGPAMKTKISAAFVTSAVALLHGCGRSSTDLNYQEFKDKLHSIAFKTFGGNPFECVVLKSALINTFGQPERIQQDGEGRVFLYYSIADGELQIEGVDSFWNGTEKWVEIESTAALVHPIMARLNELPMDAAGAPDPEQSTKILVEWYLEKHPNPYTVVGPDPDTGWYLVHENGKYRYVEMGPSCRKSKECVESIVRDLLARDAKWQLDEEVAVMRSEHNSEMPRKTIEEPVLAVVRMRVY